MENINNSNQAPTFLLNGGNIGREIANIGWQSSPLGAIESWSIALQQVISIMLASPLPTLICWQKEYIQFYNDAFHPIAKKYNFGHIGASIKDTKALDSVKAELMKVRNGHAITLQNVKFESDKENNEEAYFDICCSPIRNVSGLVEGVLILFVETTTKIHTFGNFRSVQQNLNALINRAPIGICILKGNPLLVDEANDQFLSLIGLEKEMVKRKPFWDFNKTAKKIYENVINRALQTGFTSRISEQELSINKMGIVETIFVDFSFEPLRDRNDSISGITVLAIDVSDKVLANRSLQSINDDMVAINEELYASNEELQAINEELEVAHNHLQASMDIITDREQQILSLIESAPFPIAVYVGKEMKISQANNAIIEVWGKGPNVIGKTYFELLPELETQNIYSNLEEVFDTGIAFHARNQRVDLVVEGELKEFYFNYSFTPLRDNSGKVYGVMNTAANVTDLVLAKQKVEYSEQNFRNMILQAPVAMCLLKGDQFVIELVNEPMLEIWGKSLNNVLNRPVFEALPDAKEQGLEQVMEGVYSTQKPFFAYDQPITLVRHGKPDIVYQNFVYQPYHDGNGNILGILAISVNVTDQVRARLELNKAYEQATLSKEAAQLGTFDMDIVNHTMEWDNRCRELFGISHRNKVTYEEDFLGRLHPDDVFRVADVNAKLFEQTQSTGDYDIEYRTIGAEDNKMRWVRAKGKIYFNDQQSGRFIGTMMDITEQKLTELLFAEYTEKQARLAVIVNSTDDIIISKTLDGIITSWNVSAERAFGYTESEVIGKHISLIIPPDKLKEEEFIISEIRNGKKVDHFETTRMGKGGTEVHLSITVSPIVDEEGNIIGASKIARDISAQLASQEAAKKYTERLEIMNMVIGTVSTELGLNKILQKVTDATTSLTGAKFGAFFYNQTNELGESYMLYTLSGAPREAFDKFGMPRNTAVFHPTFSGQGVVRVDDITKDPRYGKNNPHFGMPKGHLQVVSYLAVPVISGSGAVIGGLFFGHPEPSRFTEEHEILVTSIAAQAAIGLDNSKLFEEVKALNDKKDEFIGLASHELKTPLASISGYLQILNKLISDNQQQKFLEKASRQVAKLTSLVNDLLDISKIEAGMLRFTIAEFDMKKVIDESIELTRHSAPKHQLHFQSDAEVCVVDGDSQRIEQVIINLLSNAVKYSPQADQVNVFLKCFPEKVLVSISDFGLGIPEDKMNNIFKRFFRINEDTPNISGLGIGLYLAKEIITRHNGEIWVESEVGKGSTFFFYLPTTKAIKQD